MKKKLVTMILFIFIVALSACSSDGENQENNNEIENASISFAEANFDISLPNTSGDLVNLSPDGKTIYAYFTGVTWQICITQLVELNNYAEKELKGIKIYAISYSTPEEHKSLQEVYNLDGFEFLSDEQLEFGDRFGFYNEVENMPLRGYIGVNPETENIIKKVDYLVGENIKEVLKAVDEL